MSKLLEKLRKAAQTAPHQIGFGVQPREAKRATMVLVAEIPTPSADLARRAIKAGADALFVTGWQRPEELHALKGATGETPWGAGLPEHYEGKAQSLIDAGCDYVVFNPSGTRAAVLGWEKIGKALELSPEIPDTRLRAVGMLPISLAILDDGGAGPFTIDDLLDLARLMLATRKPSVLRVRTDVATADLATLRDGGIDGIMLRVGEAGWEDRLRQFRETIDTLPARTKRETPSIEPVLPQARIPERSPQPEEE